MPRNVAIQVAGSMLHLPEKFVSALHEALRKVELVEPSSTPPRNHCGNKKLRDKLRETLPGVKSPCGEKQILASPTRILKERCG